MTYLNKSTDYLRIIILSITCLGFISTNVQASEQEQQTLVIGKITSNPMKHYRYLKPMIDYAVSQLHDLGIKQGKVLMAKNNRQMIRYLKQGKVDWITETVFSAVEFQQKTGAELLLLKWKKGVPKYHTVFVARQGSGIQTLNDLTGKTIAFQDSGSTSAFYIPASTLLQKKLKLEKLKSPRQKPTADHIGYVFAREEINMSTWVNNGLVDAPAFGNLDWEKEDHMPTSFKKNLNIIHRTRDYPRSLEIVRKNLPQTIKTRLKTLLLAAHNTSEGKQAMKMYQKTSRFEEINDQMIQAIDHARKLKYIIDGTL